MSEQSESKSITFDIQTLKGDVFKVECDSTKTVADLKSKIKEFKKMDSNLRLVYSGAILSDSKVLVDVGYTPDKKLIMLASKVKKKPVVNKPTPVSTVSALASTATFTPTAASAPAPASAPASAPAPTSTPALAPTPAASSPTSSVSSASTTTPTSGQTLQQNPLFATMPLLILQLMQLVESPDVMKKVLDDEEVKKELVKDSKYRKMLLNNPAVRTFLLKLNPQFSQLESQNPEAFKSLVEDPTFMTSGVNMLNTLAQSGMMGGLPMGGQMGQTGGTGNSTAQADEDMLDQQIASSVGLTTEQMKEVDDIMGMGFSPKSYVIQIYVACDKNKESTIMLLTEQ
jgi:hypothetical protein